MAEYRREDGPGMQGRPAADANVEVALVGRLGLARVCAAIAGRQPASRRHACPTSIRAPVRPPIWHYTCLA